MVDKLDDLERLAILQRYNFCHTAGKSYADYSGFGNMRLSLYLNTTALACHDYSDMAEQREIASSVYSEVGFMLTKYLANPTCSLPCKDDPDIGFLVRSEELTFELGRYVNRFIEELYSGKGNGTESVAYKDIVSVIRDMEAMDSVHLGFKIFGLKERVKGAKLEDYKKPEVAHENVKPGKTNDMETTEKLDDLQKLQILERYNFTNLARSFFDYSEFGNMRFSIIINVCSLASHLYIDFSERTVLAKKVYSAIGFMLTKYLANPTCSLPRKDDPDINSIVRTEELTFRLAICIDAYMGALYSGKDAGTKSEVYINVASAITEMEAIDISQIGLKIFKLRQKLHKNGSQLQKPEPLP